MEMVWLLLGAIVVVGGLIALAILRLNSFESFFEAPFFRWRFIGKAHSRGEPDNPESHSGDLEQPKG